MKTEKKYLGMEIHSGEGVVKKDKFPHSRKPYIGVSVGSFGISEGNITGGKKKKQKQDMCLTTTTSGETAQTLKSASSEWELDREAWAASLILRVRTRLECP